MDFRIRDFTSEDYPACVRIGKAVYPDHNETEEDWRYHDEHRDPKTSHRRWIAESGGEVVGWAEYDQAPWMFHPRKYFLHAQVAPVRTSGGIGSSLLEVVLSALRERGALMVRAAARESHPEAVRFLQKRGFVEERRGWESELDLKAFDESKFAGVVEGVEMQGIEMITFADLSARDADWKRKLHELEVELGRDVPRPDEYTPISFEFFEKELLGDPMYLPEGAFVAIDGGRLVGMSQLWARRGENKLGIGLTGVLREHRGRHIATALKLKGIAFAKARGAGAITTGNDTLNAPILAINEKMGFKRKPVWVNLAKRLEA
jgi:GNAT superfamily N-acetyltransferase